MKRTILTVAIDTELEVALLQTGSKDLLIAYQDGGGWGPHHFLKEATRPFDEELLNGG